MRALTVRPGEKISVEVRDVPDPVPAAGELLVRGLAVGVCGTDKEIARGEYGWAPADREWLVLGHESLRRVRQAPPGSGFSAGDLVAGVVRRPDPEPCGACAHGEFDMCRNGRYTERGIKEIDGYGAQAWCVEADYAVKLAPHLQHVGVLMEPTSVVAKAWEQIERVGARSWFEPRRALVMGAGPIGLLAALLGTQRGLEVHVLDRVSMGAGHDTVARELARRVRARGQDAQVWICCGCCRTGWGTGCAPSIRRPLGTFPGFTRASTGRFCDLAGAPAQRRPPRTACGRPADRVRGAHGRRRGRIRLPSCRAVDRSPEGSGQAALPERRLPDRLRRAPAVAAP